MIDGTQKPDDLDRELALPLPWEISGAEAADLRRRIEGERNRAGQERMMALMRQGRR